MGDTQRKYAMTKLREGDWLLPSNDGAVIWRINRYDDPEFVGQTHGWQVHRIKADRLQRLFNSPNDPWEWEHWEYRSGGFATRQQAVDDALAAS